LTDLGRSALRGFSGCDGTLDGEGHGKTQDGGRLRPLDGTLIDSVYQHVLAWHEALLETGIELSIWRIHRRIGMSGGLFTRALLRDMGRDLDLNRVQFETRSASLPKPPGGRRSDPKSTGFELDAV
jgi:hypothetical protein